MSDGQLITATPASPPPTRTGRLPWVDGMRVYLTALVVAHHAALTYSTIPLWYWLQPGSDPSATGLTIFVIVNQAWFMGAFFLLSGLFVPGSYDRKGARRFSTDRLLRLGVPLLIFVVLIRPLVMLPAALTESAAAAEQGRPFSLVWTVLTIGDPGPTWFLEVLLVFSLLYAAIRSARADRSPAPPAPQPDPQPDPQPLPWWGPVVLVAVMTLITVGWRFLVPDGTYWPVVGLPTPAYLPQYASLFVAGILAARAGWLHRLRPGLVWPAVVTLPIAAALAVSAGVAGPGLAPVLVALGQSLFAVGSAVTVIAIAQRVLRREPGRLHRFLSDQAFAVYLIHPVVLVGWAAVLAPLDVSSVLHAALLLALSLPTCWLLAAAVRRIPGVRRVL